MRTKDSLAPSRDLPENLSLAIRAFAEASDPTSSDARAMAVQSGLPEDVAEDVASALRAAPARPSLRELFAPFGQAAKRVGGRMKDALSHAYGRPVSFILSSVGVLALLLAMSPLLEASLGGVAAAALVGSVALIVLASHLGCFFVRARITYPLISAAAFFAAGVAIMVFIVDAAGGPDQAPASGPPAVVRELAEESPRPAVRRALTGGISIGLILSIAVFILSLVWAGIGIFTAIVGGWSLVRREETAVHRLSRQELLSRLFDRQSRLAALAAQGRLVRRRTMIAWTSGPYGFWGLSAIIGFVSGLVLAAATGWMRALAIEERSFWLAMTNITTWVLMSLGLVVAGILGRQARRPGKAALGAVIALGAAVFALAIPFPTFGPEFVRELAVSRILLPYLLASAGVAALVGMAGEVEGRAQTLRGLKGDDPALLMADIIRIQRRLAPRSQGVCVAVVDVVRSTRMKLNAPPLDIEFSFREYQNLAAAAAAAQGGEVISTAGDGAVLSFPSAEQAFRGSRAILRDLARFNREVNRLSTEFRVRIGLHCGETAADLGEAPYNELIDIAAHVESKAPSNGIALTQAVAAELPGEALAEIAEPVDGQRIFFALYPLSES